VLLEVEQVGKRFGGFWALQGLDLRIEPGEIRAIIGPNGAGKSTLFNLIIGRYPPTAGEIRYQGRSLDGLSPSERARLGIAIKFQITQVFEGLSALDNVRLSLIGPRASVGNLFRGNGLSADDEALRILEIVGLEDKKHERVGSLVHGQRQWLEIGMALATKPRLLLLDEPTSGMGPDETRKTAELIKSLGRDLTIVVIEHDMEFVRSVAKTITVLSNGKLLAQGTYDEIKSDRRVIDAYLGKGG